MKSIKLLLTIFLLTLSSITFAAARTYTIQLVVFSHFTSQTLSAEQWPMITPPTELSENSATGKATALSNEVATLKKSAGYTILYTGSWTQTWPSGNGTVTLPVSNNQNLQGTLTVALGHYFDVRTNLFLTAPTDMLRQLSPQNFNNAGSTFVFQLNQHRRMKSEELNYFGTPVVGVLIKILKA